MGAHWTKPRKKDFKWIIEKIKDDKVVGTATFDKEKDAWEELNRVNIYFNDKLVKTYTSSKKS